MLSESNSAQVSNDNSGMVVKNLNEIRKLLLTEEDLSKKSIERIKNLLEIDNTALKNKVSQKLIILNYMLSSDND